MHSRCVNLHPMFSAGYMTRQPSGCIALYPYLATVGTIRLVMNYNASIICVQSLVKLPTDFILLFYPYTYTDCCELAG